MQFTRDIVGRALALRELDFARRGNMKMWRLGKRLVRPPHVRRALQIRGMCLNKHAYFDGLLARFSEGEEESEEDVPLALLMQERKAAAVRGASQGGDEDEDEEDSVDDDIWSDEDDEEDEQHGPTATRAPPRPSRHRETYAPFVYAPDLITPAHPFGVYAPGTIPDPLGAISDGVHRRPAAMQYDEDSEEDVDLMPDETDDEALDVELAGEALLDAIDARAAAAYEAGVWRELRGAPRPQRRTRKRTAPEVEREHAYPVRPSKRRKTVRLKSVDALKSPDGVKVKSAAMIEDSDSDEEYVG